MWEKYLTTSLKYTLLNKAFNKAFNYCKISFQFIYINSEFIHVEAFLYKCITSSPQDLPKIV